MLTWALRRGASVPDNAQGLPPLFSVLNFQHAHPSSFEWRTSCRLALLESAFSDAGPLRSLTLIRCSFGDGPVAAPNLAQLLSRASASLEALTLEGTLRVNDARL